MKNIFQNIKKGFTLIELIVVISIIAVISVLTIFNSSRLNSSVLLSNNAYEIGLIVRDAQISGLGAKLSLTGQVATTSNQGVYFDIFLPQSIILFADLDKQNDYDSLEESQIYKMEDARAGKIIKICKLNDINGQCGEVISNLSVIFKRPNPEAYFYVDRGNNIIEPHQGSVGVNIGFENGECRSVIVYKTGAVQIDKSLCTPIEN
jgi:prepilin-type N-terminal cleavage/methylation domain-containing protein